MLNSQGSAIEGSAFRDALREQAAVYLQLGSPFMHQLMALLAERLRPTSAPARTLLALPDDRGKHTLRIAAALHALALRGIAPGLPAAHPAAAAGAGAGADAVSDDALWDAVVGALQEHGAFVDRWLSHAPQTNEVARATALAPACHMLAAATRAPLALWELGCSAGLNLRADRFCVAAPGAAFGPRDSAVQLAPEWHGPVPAPADVRVAQRRGIDLNPMDITDDDALLRLRAYFWADQPARRTRFDAAVAIAHTCPADIEAGDAVEWLRRQLPRRLPGVCTVVYHSVAWMYFPQEAKDEGEALLQAAGAAATPESPLARVAVEPGEGKYAELTVTLWPGGTPQKLADVAYHGGDIQWVGPVRLDPL